MYANSSPITSAQTARHEQLLTLVDKHARSQFLKPILDYNREAFELSMSTWKQAGEAPLILDAGCGVGLSTLHLAARYPDHFVIGVDQSADRLARMTAWQGEIPFNLMWVRADLVDYWRLMYLEGIRPARHYILYPNPWPKIGHVARRWHGHAVFPTIAALGGELECRSNWQIYIDELSVALNRLTGLPVACETFEPQSPITPFEQKYLLSGHRLWRCRASLPGRI
jgi:tRNA G46 methylase TrmB